MAHKLSKTYYKQIDNLYILVHHLGNSHLGPVVQSIVSFMSSLRGQLVKC